MAPDKPLQLTNLTPAPQTKDSGGEPCPYDGEIYPHNSTGTDPKTGKKYICQDGTWVPVEG